MPPTGAPLPLLPRGEATEARGDGWEARLRQFGQPIGGGVLALGFAILVVWRGGTALRVVLSCTGAQACPGDWWRSALPELLVVAIPLAVLLTAGGAWCLGAGRAGAAREAAELLQWSDRNSRG